MLGTSTWPTPTSLAHAAPAGPSPEPGRVLRIRVFRRAVRTHRGRRDVALPTIRRAGSYVVRVHRPADAAPLRILRVPVAAPHRARRVR